jgi:hypothetical protein
MCPPLCEVCTEAVSAHVCHVVFVRERRNSDGGVFAIEGIVKEDKIGEPPPDLRLWRLEGFEVSLPGCKYGWELSAEGLGYFCGDQIRYVDIFCASFLLLRSVNGAFQSPVGFILLRVFHVY